MPCGSVFRSSAGAPGALTRESGQVKVLAGQPDATTVILSAGRWRWWLYENI